MWKTSFCRNLAVGLREAQGATLTTIDDSTDINTRQNVEFLTMDRSVSSQNLKLFNSFRDFSDLLAFSINLMTGWLSWAGLWLVLIFLIIARQLLEKGADVR
jgi:hypothetical protein